MSTTTASNITTITATTDAGGKPEIDFALTDGTILAVPASVKVGPTPPPPLPAPPGFTASLGAGGTAILAACSVVAGAALYRLHETTDGTDPDTSPTARRYDSPVPSWSLPVTPGPVAIMHRLCPAAVDARGVQGACSPDLMVTVPATGPVLPPLNILSLIPGDDSVVIKIQPFPGAADYIAFDSANPMDVKASGGNTLLEWNGFPVVGKLIVQAIDSIAPYQAHGAMPMPGMLMVTNGHAFPANAIRPIAQSAPITPRYAALGASAGASQVAIATFNPVPKVIKSSDGATFSTFKTDDGKWSGACFNADFRQTDPAFAGHTHMMWNFFPGLTAPNPAYLQQNGTVTWEFLPGQADISGGRVAHFRYECDAHMPQNGRRWWEIYAIPQADQVLNPEKLDVPDFTAKPTTSGKMLVHQVMGQFHQVFTVDWVNGAKVLKSVTHTSWGDPAGAGDRGGPCLRGTAEGGVGHPYKPDGSLLNGTIKDIDLRHRFDIYLSSSHIRLYETDAEGVRVLILDRALTLPFTGPLRWVIAGKVYHPLNDNTELTGEDLAFYWQQPSGQQGISYGRDMRHIDSVLSEVLSAFPAL